jgi:hypothetical protein
MGLTEESDELHLRVQRYAGAQGSTESFDSLALAIARFQQRHSPGFARLVRQHHSSLDTVQSIPALPSVAFRLARVALHPETLDVAKFYTSGTTLSERGVHPFRRLDTYRALSLNWGHAALASSLGRGAVVVALAPRPHQPPTSSLACMMQFFIDEFAGPWSVLPRVSRDAAMDDRWLVHDTGVDIAGLERAIEAAHREGRPLLVLATAFALVALLDAVAGRCLQCPDESLFMVTGGFKGRSRSVEPGLFRRQIAECAGLSESRIVAEYGMTELTSQLYEGTAPGAVLHGPRDVLLSPPWLRVEAVDGETLSPMPRGEPGLACFTDLGNIDSVVRVVTKDLIVEQGPGLRLLGRAPKSPARGCSLALESLLASGVSPKGQRG